MFKHFYLFYHAATIFKVYFQAGLTKEKGNVLSADAALMQGT